MFLSHRYWYEVVLWLIVLVVIGVGGIGLSPILFGIMRAASAPACMCQDNSSALASIEAKFSGTRKAEQCSVTTYGPRRG